MLAQEHRRRARACGLFLMIILLITALLPLAVAFPSGQWGPGVPTVPGASQPCSVTGMGSRWHCAWCPRALQQPVWF